MPVSPIPIPQNLDLCGSLVDKKTFVQLVNENFELIVQEIQQTQSIEIQIPGIPDQAIEIPGVSVPPLVGGRYGIRGMTPSLPEGWLGGRYPMRFPGGNKSAYGVIPGFDGLNVGGQEIDIPAVDPYTKLMQYVNINFQLLVKQVPSLSTVIVNTPVSTWSPCSANPTNPPGSTGPGPTIANTIQKINFQLQQIITHAGGGGGCPPIVLPAFTSLVPPMWNVLLGTNFTYTPLSPTSFRFDTLGVNGNSASVLQSPTFTKGTCLTLTIQYQYTINVGPRLFVPPGANVGIASQVSIFNGSTVNLFLDNATFSVSGIGPDVFSGTVNASISFAGTPTLPFYLVEFIVSQLAIPTTMSWTVTNVAASVA